MPTAVLSLLGGIVLLAIGAEGLVRGASSAARRLGISPLIIGLTVVAYGTSAPELVVSVYAAIEGNAAVALGNVVGSNIGNIGLILGIAALLCPIRVRAQILKLDVPIMVGVTALLLALLADGGVGRWDGLVLLAGAAGYTLICVWGAWDESSTAVQDTFDAGVPAQGGWGRDLLYGMGGLALLVGGARLLVNGAVTIASAAGLSASVIGLTVVALGTSLPELATSVVAAGRGESDIALGNVVGSNIFNVLGILGLTATIHPVSGAGLTWVDGGVMMGFAVLLLPLLWTGYTLERGEGSVFLLLYVGYVTVLVGGLV